MSGSRASLAARRSAASSAAAALARAAPGSPSAASAVAQLRSAQTALLAALDAALPAAARQHRLKIAAGRAPTTPHPPHIFFAAELLRAGGVLPGLDEATSRALRPAAETLRRAMDAVLDRPDDARRQRTFERAWDAFEWRWLDAFEADARLDERTVETRQRWTLRMARVLDAMLADRLVEPADVDEAAPALLIAVPRLAWLAALREGDGNGDDRDSELRARVAALDDGACERLRQRVLSDGGDVDELFVALCAAADGAQHGGPLAAEMRVALQTAFVMSAPRVVKQPAQTARIGNHVCARCSRPFTQTAPAPPPTSLLSWLWMPVAATAAPQQDQPPAIACATCHRLVCRACAPQRVCLSCELLKDIL